LTYRESPGYEKKMPLLVIYCKGIGFPQQGKSSELEGNTTSYDTATTTR
jgi:hypothetical protein